MGGSLDSPDPSWSSVVLPCIRSEKVLSVVAARIKPVSQRHGSTNLSTSVRPLQGKLNKPRGADDRRDACEGAGSLDVERRGDRERWMIREIEKVRPEAEAVSLGDLERLSDGEVHVLLRRSGEAVAGNIAEPSGVTSGTVGERYDGVRYEGSRVQPVGQTRFRAAVGGCYRFGPPLQIVNTSLQVLAKEGSNRRSLGREPSDLPPPLVRPTAWPSSKAEFQRTT